MNSGEKHQTFFYVSARAINYKIVETTDVEAARQLKVGKEMGRHGFKPTTAHIPVHISVRLLRLILT